EALLDMLQPAAGQDRARLDSVLGLVEAEGRLFAAAQDLMDLLLALGMLFEKILQVHRAVGDMARFILHAKPENLLLDRRQREHLAVAEQGQHEALAQ